MKISEAIIFIINIENIKTKNDLDEWCGDVGRQKLYLYVQKLASDHWSKVQKPECVVRAYYQPLLKGYKRCNKEI